MVYSPHRYELRLTALAVLLAMLVLLLLTTWRRPLEVTLRIGEGRLSIVRDQAMRAW